MLAGVMFAEKKMRTRLLRAMGRAVEDFGMIEHGDRLMVCFSGGKDSYTLLDLLLDVRERARSISTCWQLIWIKNSRAFLKMFCRSI